MSHVLYFTPVLYGLLLLWTAAPVIKGRADRQTFCLGFAALVGCATLINAAGRTDLAHLRQGIHPLFVVLGMSLSSLIQALRRPGMALRLVRALAALLVLSYGYGFAKTALFRTRLLPSRKRLRRMHAIPSDLQSVVAYVESRVSPTENLFVTPRTMDVYNITGRLNPFRYGDLFPGVFGRHPRRAEAALVADLREKAGVVVLDTKPWRAGSGRVQLGEYAPLVYAFIVEECYETERLSERYIIYRRVEPRSGGPSSRDVEG
jgi:hypothetical protein